MKQLNFALQRVKKGLFSVTATTTSSRLVVVVVVGFSRVDDRLDYDYATDYDYNYSIRSSR